MNIYVIDLATRKHMATMDGNGFFIPRREENIILQWGDREVECKVLNVVHCPKHKSVIVFVDVRNDYYKNIIDEIRW